MAILTSAGNSVHSGPRPWSALLKASYRDPQELCRELRLPAEWVAQAGWGHRQFPLFAPPGYVAKITPGDPQDPLLAQILPLAAEAEQPPGYGPDPLAEEQSRLTPGLLQKYHGRALLIVTGACAVHCRYCFRRHFPYQESLAREPDWEPALQRLREDSSLQEVLLSGGDPLMRSDDQLARLVQRLEAIPHLARLRLHTRMPVVIPERVTDALLAWLGSSRLQPIVVLHVNHPRELDAPVVAAAGRLRDAGALVLNQAVLLAGVNDNLSTLAELCERLVEARILPYYLHQLDRVQGAAHFEVPESRGRQLVDQLRQRLPGYAVPRYVRETAGAPYKELIG